MSESKTILWHAGAPWAQTGYGVQTDLFRKRIETLGHKVICSATWGLDGRAVEWDGTLVLPRDSRWGNITMPEYARRYNADLVIALMDAWVLDPDRMRDLPLAVWTPVDHQPTPPKVADFFRRSGARPIAMSRFGERMLTEEGLDPLYVPHGVDTSVYKPRDREQIRRLAGEEGSFIVGIVANNAGGMPPAGGPPRKAFPQSLMAFSNFYRSHPDAKLYIHAELSGRPGLENGLNLAKLLDRFEIPPEAVKFTDQVQMEIGIDAEAMSLLYNSFDVLLNPSYGEGFGVPIIEAQACGTPVIASNWTAMPELVGAGWLVEGDPTYNPAHDAFWLAPNVGDVMQALEVAYVEASGLREKAREFALQYDADKVLDEYWRPALEELFKPREVAPLNREMRRKLKKEAV